MEITKNKVESLTVADKVRIVKSWRGDIVMHLKGDKYLVMEVAEHSSTGEYFVVYKALYGDCLVYVRPVSEFMEWVKDRKDNVARNSIRFEPINITSERLKGLK